MQVSNRLLQQKYGFRIIVQCFNDMYCVSVKALVYFPLVFQVLRVYVGSFLCYGEQSSLQVQY